MMMPSLRHDLLERHGMVEARPHEAPLVETRVSEAGMEIPVYALGDAHQAMGTRW
jgi:hypothetical protein